MAAIALILEDRPDLRQALSHTVETSSLFDRLLFSSSDAETLATLERDKVDMLFCDWRPETGPARAELLRLLAKRDEWAEIPVVAFCAARQADMRVDALESGVHDCFDYTLPLRELVARLRLQLRQRERTRKLHEERSHLRRLALNDMLTGLFNRAYFDATLEAEAARSRRTGAPLSLLMIDLDHFKTINDLFGHPAGDQALRLVAKTVRGMVRRSDIVCRFGGEEFAVILPDTPMANALTLAEKVRRRIATLLLAPQGRRHPLSVSIGISGAAGFGSAVPERILEEADRALYLGKQQGRNQCATFPSPHAPAGTGPFPTYPGFVFGFA